MILLRCDHCGIQAMQIRKMPLGWRTVAEYKLRGARRVFVRMKHSCPDCPADIPREGLDDLPVRSAQEGLLEVETCARFALLDDQELKGTARMMVIRALAILDAARGRVLDEAGGTET